MYSFTRKVFFLVGLTLCVSITVFSQTVTSTRDGLWNDPAVWSGGVVPTPANSTATVVDHQIIVPAGASISILNVAINGSVTVETSATVALVADGFPGTWDFHVTGTFTMQDGATFSGTTTSNTFFDAGSRYVHLQGPLGYVPLATWHPASTFEIAGFRTQGYINIAHSDTWKQIFGNVVYNCTQQTTAFVDLNGYLRDIAGNLHIQSTNNQALRLSTTQNTVISIGGDLIVDGNSKVWLSTNATNGTINVRGNFRYRSVSTGISYCTTKGRMTINVDGEFEINSAGRIHLASTSTDSVGIRQTTLRVNSDFRIVSGIIIGPPAPGRGTILFDGNAVQNVVTSATGSSFQGTIDYIIESGATVNLGTSVLSNQSGTLLVRGRLQLGSTHPAGAIQTVNQGNLHIQNTRTFEAGSSLEYNGMAAQWIGNGHPSSVNVDLICNNPVGVTLLKSLDTRDFVLSGVFNAGSFQLSVAGDLTVGEGSVWNAAAIYFTGSNNQTIRAGGMEFGNIVINKSPNTAVTLEQPLTVSEALEIQSPATRLHTGGYLTLLSSADEGPGTARVGPLPAGSAIMGDVTVQRFMRGEGRIYRYISSPVQNATVRSFMDDFPVTGTFQDPSVGPGISSNNPSFFYYDESVGTLQAGWRPYPTSSLASANPLVVGKGYAAFIRKGSGSTTWDVTGPLNQGTIELPVAFSSNSQPSNGWNLVGNPYASAIQWDLEGSDRWTLQNISSVISIRDNGLGTGSGTFRYWDMDDNYSEIPGGQIASGQSFWVRATAPNPKLTIREGVKVTGDATFFRKKGEWIPSFSVRISLDSLTDVAYYKIRPGAQPTLDAWDGVKLDNERFDVSFLSDDGKSLAIHATNEMPGDRAIEIHVKDLAAGTYTMSLDVKYDFRRYTFTLIDRFLNTEQEIIPQKPLSFQISNVPASAASNRFVLRTKEARLKKNLQVIAPPTTCGMDVVSFEIRHAEPGVRYSLWSEGRQLTRDSAVADGDLTLMLATDSLHGGKHAIQVQAKTPFQTALLDTVIFLTKDDRPVVMAGSSRNCLGGPVRLSAVCNRVDALLLWYEERGGEPVAATEWMDVPDVMKPAVFYVKAIFPFGCESEFVEVKTDVIIVDSARIEVVGDSVLVTNSSMHNTWFLNDEKLSESKSIPLAIPGTYRLEVDTLGCRSVDTFEYMVMGFAENDKGDVVGIYPTIVDDRFYVKGTVDKIDIYNAVGMLMTRRERMTDGSIEVDDLAGGLYYVVLVRGGNRKTVRLVVSK